MLRLLILGGNGQVGMSLANHCEKNSLEYKLLTRKQLDITSGDMVDSFFASDHEFDFVINAAAYTAVDKAESESELAFSTNGIAVKYLAEQCRKYTIPLLHISTDYVFDGKKTIPYTEDDIASPINIYGKSKLQGEQFIKAIWEKHIILRVSWIFSATGYNFIKSILKLGQEKEKINVVADQIGCPTAAEHIAVIIISICQEQLRSKRADQQWGIYQYVDFPVTTWHQLAKYTLNKAKQIRFPIITQCVIPISSADYKTVAKRPFNSILSVNKLETTFNIKQFYWQQGVDYVLKQITRYKIK